MNKVYENKGATKEETSKPGSKDREMEPTLGKQKISLSVFILSELEPMVKNKIKQSEILLEQIMQFDVTSNEGNDFLISSKNHWALKFLFFCVICSNQQKTNNKKIQKF